MDITHFNVETPGNQERQADRQTATWSGRVSALLFIMDVNGRMGGSVARLNLRSIREKERDGR